jgi:hypothetical protein
VERLPFERAEANRERRFDARSCRSRASRGKRELEREQRHGDRTAVPHGRGRWHWRATEVRVEYLCEAHGVPHRPIIGIFRAV